MMPWCVRWSAAARSDVQAITRFIARDNPDAAGEILARLQRRAESLDRFPRRGRRIAEFTHGGEREYRELIETPWRILYWIADRQVQIMAVVDGRRNVVKWLYDSKRLPPSMK